MDHDETVIEGLIRMIRTSEKHLFINPLEVRLLMGRIEEIEPFHNITDVCAKSSRGHPSWEDLRFLELFPNTRILMFHDINGPYEPEAKPMSFDGIQNCLNLEEVHAFPLVVPPVLSGIEFCTSLRKFALRVSREGNRPMDITPLSRLPFLESIQVIPDGSRRGARVETEYLDLSDCESLESLNIRPTSKDLRFLGTVQLKNLCAPCAELESLDGLDITRLKRINLKHNKITCIERLRGANLRSFDNSESLEGNPVDPNDLKEVSSTWV